ncbi:MAG: DUF5011 domain-containing protein, partial [Mariprofundus sp.]|nr:DUF5011 domain-containing protein [Mariprofundus sp.]
MRHFQKLILLTIILFSGANIASAVCPPACGGGGFVDTTPPVNQITPVISNIANTTADFTAQTNEMGNGFYIVVATGSTAPTAAQVKAQVPYPGVTTIVANGVVGMQAFTNTVMNMTGLTIGTAYTAYFVADDLAFNLQANPASAALTTTGAANAAPVLGGTFTTNGAVNDNVTITPFAQVTVSDANAGDQISVAISFTALNGTLAGTGITGSAGSYTVTAATQATAQTNLQAAVFTPTAGQVTTGLTVATTFTLTPNDGTINGAANATTQVTATSIARNANVENSPALTGTTFSDTGNQMGQSFTAPRTGTLASINIASSVASTGATLKIYSGEGTAGALLHTQTIAVLNNTAVTAAVVQSYAYQAVPLDAAVAVTSGQVYTLDITATGYFPVYDANNYVGGMQYNAGTGIPNNDNFFQAVINGANNAPALGGAFVTAGAINDNATTAPFAGVTLADADGDMLSVNITYTAANGTLSGTGISGTAGNYTVDSAVIATAQSNLQAITFTPTINQVAVGNTTVTNFTVTPNDTTTNGAVDATTQVTTTAMDHTPPVITLTGAATINHEAGTAYTDLGATAVDNFDAALAAVTVSNPVDVNVAGTYSVTYNVSDASGNAATQVSRSVIVADTTPPVITLTGAATINHEAGTAYADQGATAADSFDNALTAVTVSNPVNINVAGTYTVTYNVSDASGNAATQVSRSVIVADTIAPVIGALTPVATVEARGTNTALFLTPPTATDTFTVTLTNDAPVVTSTDLLGLTTTGTSFPLGTTVVTWTATDANNNQSTATQNIVVQDTTPPTLSLKGAASVTLAVGDVFTDPGATSTDLNPGDLDVSIVKGGTFVDTTAAGTFTITYDVVKAGIVAPAQVTRTIIVNATVVRPVPFAGFNVAKNLTSSFDANYNTVSADLNGDGKIDIAAGGVNGVTVFFA